MAEHSDIYLLLYRETGAYQMVSGNKLTIPLLVPKLLKGMIMGDSLDAPFVGFIKVNGVEHGIGLGKDQKELEWGDKNKIPDDDLVARRTRELYQSLDDDYGRQVRPLLQMRGVRAERQRLRGLRNQRRQDIAAAHHAAVREQRHAFINSHLPKHEELTFTKMIDRATPQLAFGCSAQERYPCALFFYRRKIGLGIGGIRVPHLTIGLRKVRISSWKMTGEETESVSLRYADIAWAALGGIADANLPSVPSARMFSEEDNAGGENYSSSWAYAVGAIGAGLTAIAGGVTKGLEAASGEGSYK